MSWLALLKTLIGGVASISKWMGDRQLIEAGEAKQVARRLLRERDRVQKAINAAANTKHDANSVHNDPANRN